MISSGYSAERNKLMIDNLGQMREIELRIGEMGLVVAERRFRLIKLRLNKFPSFPPRDAWPNNGIAARS